VPELTPPIKLQQRNLQDWEDQPTFGNLNPASHLSSNQVLQMSSLSASAESAGDKRPNSVPLLLQGLEAQALNRQLVAAVVLNKWSMIEALAYTLEQYSEGVTPPPPCRGGGGGGGGGRWRRGSMSGSPLGSVVAMGHCPRH
jgi:hypothetical protein